MNKTALFISHQDLKAKIVPFAGYEMPLFYDLGIIEEHKWVRSKCGIFDVSHMGQLILEGENAAEMLSYLTPTNFRNLANFKSRYTVLLNKSSAILDDLIITKLSDEKFFIVVNAACKKNDIQWFNKFLSEFNSNLTTLDQHSLIAVQGPLSEKVLSKILDIDLADLEYMSLMKSSYNNNEIFITRSGYTGEDGFEISINNVDALDLWKKLLTDESVSPIGLAARDSLRIEMGYPLYGHDITNDTPIKQTALSWVITNKEHDFIGKESINDNNFQKKRIGFKLLDKGIAREGMEIYNEDNKLIGEVTSAAFSPILECSIGQGYVNIDDSKIGNKVKIKIRSNYKEAIISKIMLLPAKTKK